ncbi:MFS transporter [Orrella sp. NBD-18]|uniref:MFS transporter n=1 Tax=Sheuella amnicola TaxID=2707330 RepID=A0A6B2R2L4_9BURK|nr:MFS transporter [Sheuella amnicola]NDY84308.1 MFS transporter [Sheuella amnicola]
MISTIANFPALYLSTLLILVSTGLFNTYMALRLSADGVSEVWIGALIAAYYLGLVLGARVSHRLIIRVGHIRAFAAAAVLSICMVLAQMLLDSHWVWLILRAVAGLSLVTQYVVIESWLNEQAENNRRGRVMSVYLIMSGTGTALGQLAITLYPSLDLRPLVFVAICQALSLFPIVLTRQTHPAAPMPAPLDFEYFWKMVPHALLTVFLAGCISGSFYGLSAVYAVKQNLTTAQVAIFTATSVIAGLVSQWPMGWLADRFNRRNIVRINASVLILLTTSMWGWMTWPFWFLLLLAAGLGVFQFTLYALASGLANDGMASEHRVSLAAVFLMAYGIGACLGPIIAGALMRFAGAEMLYVFSTVCALILLIVMTRKGKVPEPST